MHHNQLHLDVGTTQGQTVFIKGFQLQSGKSNDTATASQIKEISIDAGNEQTNGSVEQKQTTKGSLTLEQTTTTENPAHLLQSQSNTTAIFHFQGKIEGGPSIQTKSHRYIPTSFPPLVRFV